MNIKGWIGVGSLLCMMAMLQTGCDEFDQQACEDSWQCRTSFGVGYICVDDNIVNRAGKNSPLKDDIGFCVRPDIPDGCDTTEYNYPPDIFTRADARRSITLGVIADEEGRQSANAMRVALELANIKGGINNIRRIEDISEKNPLAGYKFTAVACKMRGSAGQSQSAVTEVARFLRDDIQVQGVLLGLSNNATVWAVDTLSVADDLTGVPSETLIVSANAGGYGMDAKMSSTNTLWTVAISENEILRRLGEQVLLQRIERYASAILADENYEDEHPDVIIDSMETLLPAAVNQYLDDQSGDESIAGEFVIHGMLLAEDSSQSGSFNYTDRRHAAIQEGIENALDKIAANNAELRERLHPSTGDKPLILLGYAEHLLGCGGDCTPDDIKSDLEQMVLCDKLQTDGKSVSISSDCTLGASLSQVDAIMLQTESSKLVAAFIDGLASNVTVANAIGLSKKKSDMVIDQPYTTIYLPPMASSGASDFYFQTTTGKSNWSADEQKRLYDYVENERMVGIRQTGDRTSNAYQEYDSAQKILLTLEGGQYTHYMPQAYDASWAMMAGIAARVLELSPRSKSERAALKELTDSANYSEGVQRHFAGNTADEFATLHLNDELLQSMTSVQTIPRDLIPSEWSDLFGIVISDALQGTNDVFRFRGTSGELRFYTKNGLTLDKDGKVDRHATPYGGRERISYDYGIWTPSFKSRSPGETGAVSLDGCESGLLAPEPITDAGQAEKRENKFVCPTERTVCRKTQKTGKNIQDLCLSERIFPSRIYSF